MKQNGGGAWGVYDDENDTIADIWYGIENQIIPKCLHDIAKYVDSEPLYDVKKSYVRNNPKKTYPVIKKWITKEKTQLHKYPEGEQYISGIALYAARLMQGLPFSGIFNAGLLPKDLPEGYPSWLKKEGLAASKKLLVQVHDNVMGWRDITKRKKALEHQVYLFSEGKEGKKGKHPKVEKKVIRRKRKITKKKSKKDTKKKKVSRKGSIRKSPTASATMFKVGTKMTGNDGNMWIVKQYKTKKGYVKRWVRA